MSRSKLPKRVAQTLAAFRRELQVEHARLLLTLRESRSKLSQLQALAGGREICQLNLAFEIVIAIAERENFMDMPAERIAVVLSQLERRLLRLGDMLNASQTLAPFRDEVWGTPLTGHSSLAVN